MNDDLTELIRAEEAKRQRCFSPAERWRVIQETLAWAEQQRTVRRNTPAACHANQRRLLTSLAQYAAQAKAANG